MNGWVCPGIEQSYFHKQFNKWFMWGLVVFFLMIDIWTLVSLSFEKYRIRQQIQPQQSHNINSPFKEPMLNWKAFIALLMSLGAILLSTALISLFGLSKAEIITLYFIVMYCSLVYIFT